MERKSLMESVLPDLVIFNGKVITVDRKFSIAQAVAVKGGKIVAIGASDKIKTLIGKKTKNINLKGRTMLPGINDSHCHISDWALSRPPLMLDIRFPLVKSIADIVKMVGEKASQVKPEEWILGEGWDEGYLTECLGDANRKPSKEDLDKVAPDNPVALTEYSGHRVWANSRALQIAGMVRLRRTLIPENRRDYYMKKRVWHSGLPYLPGLFSSVNKHC
jgi:predicted amidohydrolase YtcJ